MVLRKIQSRALVLSMGAVMAFTGLGFAWTASADTELKEETQVEVQENKEDVLVNEIEDTDKVESKSEISENEQGPQVDDNSTKSEEEKIQNEKEPINLMMRASKSVDSSYIKPGTGYVTSNIGLNMRKGPGTGYSVVIGIPYNAKVEVLKKETNGWYQVRYSGYTGYVYGDYLNVTIEPEEVVVKPDVDFETWLNQEGFSEEYKGKLRIIHQKYPNWIFKADKTGLDFEKVIKKENGKNLINYGNGWVTAPESQIRYYMDTRNFLDEVNIFQFISNKYERELHFKSGVKSIIKGSFLDRSFSEWKYDTYADVIMEAASQSGVSPYMLASMIINEQGRNGSESAKGIKIVWDSRGYWRRAGYGEKGYTYYNFYNIGATDGGDPNLKGAVYARSQGWDTESKAIIGGARWFGNGYVDQNQHTPYLKKFNVMNGYNCVATHQYMSNVSGAWQEGRTQYNGYRDVFGTGLVFNIPLFNNISDEHINGWKQVEGGTIYLDSKGNRLKGKQVINGKNYYFDRNGILTRGIVKINGSYFYYDWEDYTLVKKGWLKFSGYNGKWAYTDTKDGHFHTGISTINSNKYLFDEKGFLQEEGKHSWNDKEYYVDRENHLFRGVVNISGKSYYYDWNDYHLVKQGWKYLDAYDNYVYTSKSTGEFLTGKQTISEGGKRDGEYYFDSNGFRYRGIKKIDGKSYYYDWSNYKLVKQGWLYFWPYDNYVYTNKSTGEFLTGKQTISEGGKRDGEYYFDSNGFRYRGIKEIDGKSYYYDWNNYKLVKQGWLYFWPYDNYVYTSKSTGEFLTGKQTISEGGNRDGEYYFDSNGFRYRGIKKIDGRSYYYDWNNYKLVKQGWLYFGGYNNKWVYTDIKTGIFFTGNNYIDGQACIFDENGFLIGTRP